MLRVFMVIIACLAATAHGTTSEELDSKLSKLSVLSQTLSKGSYGVHEEFNRPCCDGSCCPSKGKLGCKLTKACIWTTYNKKCKYNSKNSKKYNCD